MNCLGSCSIFGCPICSKNNNKSKVIVTTDLIKKETTLNYVKLHMIDDIRGFAVEKDDGRYLIAFVSKSQDKDGKESVIKEAQAYSNGKLQAYTSPFLADYVIRTEILPLYPKRKIA
jgi:hypothetical protein